MMTQYPSLRPPHLQVGDTIAIVCPAKKLPKSIALAVESLKQWGLKVILGSTVDGEYHQFSGTDAERTADLQQFLDNPQVKAIFAARGGYGCIRIIDDLDFKNFKRNPKWLIGFSDLTVLLSHCFANYNIQNIHGQMPYTFDEASPASLESLKQVLFKGDVTPYLLPTHALNLKGYAEGVLIGGNLSLLTAVLGSSSDMDYDNRILFLEDVGEHEYAIDRMLRSLDRAGKLKNLKALIIGAFNEIEPESIPFGQTVPELVRSIVDKYHYPVCFDFPTGHIEDNRSMVLGAQVSLKVDDNQVEFKYI